MRFVGSLCPVSLTFFGVIRILFRLYYGLSVGSFERRFRSRLGGGFPRFDQGGAFIIRDGVAPFLGYIGDQDGDK